MKLSSLVFVLLLSSLLFKAQGIRLGKLSTPAGRNKIQQEEDDLVRRNNGGVGEVILCKDGHCSGMMNRKLVSIPTSTSTSTTDSKNHKNEGNKADPLSKGKSSSEGLGGKEESFSVKSSPVSFHREAASERYPDILDIAGMDYSPAKRKPPIHN
ncbi:hypothetical protein RJ639_041148 [Escallonia herrerae]|uniref:Uncharacterized protein n=1 Tax=Escallonia herrerae TaxID=1293975 RepID=A0AA88WF55_9ASTE|nr:hypothetical protein RJ639_041148 [Escallonia herrerae]